MPDLTIRAAVALLRERGYTARQARHNISNWLARGLVRGRKTEPVPGLDHWLIDRDDLLAAWRERRIPPKIGRPQKAAHPKPG